MKIELIAPCGMNCSLCMAYLRDERRCPGCRDLDNVALNTTDSRKRCIIRNCELLEKSNRKYCSQRCGKFPCQRLKNLDKRYRTKYGMSMIENLEIIADKGIRKFIDIEKKKWVRGDKIFCVHKKQYYDLKKK